jgi:hypothetical protein
VHPVARPAQVRAAHQAHVPGLRHRHLPTRLSGSFPGRATLHEAQRDAECIPNTWNDQIQWVAAGGTSWAVEEEADA